MSTKFFLGSFGETDWFWPFWTEINVHISPPFLLYQNKDTGEPPYGIWFYSQFDCNRISQLVKKLHSEVVEKSKVVEPVEQKVKPPPGLFPAQQTQAETPKDDKVDILGWIFTDSYRAWMWCLNPNNLVL